MCGCRVAVDLDRHGLGNHGNHEAVEALYAHAARHGEKAVLEEERRRGGE